MMEEGETQTPFWIQQTTAAATTTTRRRSLNSGVALFILFLTSFIILSFLLIPPLLSQFSKPTLLFKRSWDSLNITLVLLALLFGFLSRNRNHDFNPTVLSDGRIDSKNEVNKSDETVDNGWYNYSVRKDGIGLSSNRNHIPTDVSFSRNRYHGPTVGFDRTDGKMGNEGNKSVNSGWYEYLDRTDTVGLGRDRNQSPTVDEADRTADIGLRRNQYHDPAVGFDRTDGKIGNEGHKSKESVNSGWYEYLGRTDTVGLGRDRNQNPTVDDDDRAADIGLRRNQYHDPTVGFDRGDDGKVGNKVQKLNEPVNGSWYEYPDPTVVVGLRRSHSSYPDLREVEDSGDRWQFHDDTSLDSYPQSGKSSPDRGLKESVYEDGTVKREVKSVNNGIVLGVGDGIARVSGLDGVTVGEIVEFDEGTIGVVMNPDSTDNVGIVLMGEGLLIREGSCVKATGKIAQEPGSVSEAGLGRVVDALDKDNDGRYGISDPEIKEAPRAVRRRTRRAAGSNGNKGKLSEEVSSMEPPSGKSSHRRTKSSGLELPNERLSHRKTKSSGFERFGTVLLVGKGVARIYGLGEVTEGEIVEFEEGTIGIVSNSESANNVGVVLMGDGLLINEGSPVKATGKIAQIPVTEARLGSVINDLTKPINSKGEIKVSKEIEIEHMPPAVRRRTRRTRGSIVDKEKSMEEVSGSEHPDQSSHRRTKRTYEESKIPKVDANDQSEVNEYESSPEMLVQGAQSSPLAQSSQSEKKKGGGNATRDFLTSLTKRKKKQRQKSVEDFDTLLESPPPSPRPSSKGFFSSKKGKNKQVITDLPPPPPLSLYTTSREQKSAPTTAPSATRRPPLPGNVQNFVEVESPKRKSSFTGAESPLHPIPPPPPPPPFKMSGWKFVMKGDYVNIGSVNSSRSVSPEREGVDSPMGSESGRNDVAMGSMFCPSPDVNSKADMFIAKFREGLKLQKMNSMKMKQGVGLSNLGPVSTLDQAQA